MTNRKTNEPDLWPGGVKRMDEKMARFVSAGKMFQKSAVAVVAAAIGTVLRLVGRQCPSPWCR